MSKEVQVQQQLFSSIKQLIEESKQQVAVVVNATMSMLYWQIGKRINEEILQNTRANYYFLREVKPHVAEAWIDLDKTKIGYEISFNKYFYQHKPLRSIEEVSAEILALDKESDGLIMDILNLG